jgi:hypothetical protein
MNRFVLATLLTSIALPAMAQQQERTYTLSLTASQLGVIGTALGEQKFKDVVGVVAAIQQQVEAQNRPPAAPAPAPDEPKKETEK